MKIFKKNQVILTVVGLMLIAAGYLNFTNQERDITGVIETGALADAEQMAGIGDATLVSTIPTEVEDNITNNDDTLHGELVENNNEMQGDIAKENDHTNEESLETNTSITTDEYFTKSRLERETMYSKRLSSYQEMIDKTTISEAQRTTAQKEITKINEEQNAIMITENLIKTKGFEDLIIFVNDDSINVIVKAKELEIEQIAQIQSIITREFKAKIDDIHITNKE